jgi:hypothetical protein
MSEQDFPSAALPLEIQQQIISCLDVGTLPSATLVSRDWHEKAINLLWESPRNPFRALSSINEHRRQHYADKIRDLGLTTLDEGLDLSVDFPNVRLISFGACLSPQMIPKILNKNVRTIKTSRRHAINAEHLELIQRRCPGIQDISFDGSFPGCAPGAFINFLQNCQFLTRIGFSWEMINTGAQYIFPRLALLDLDQTLRIAETLEDLELPDFPSERSVDVFPGRSVWGTSQDFLRFITQCKSIKTLRLGSSVDPMLTEEVFAQLGSIESIKVLELHRFLGPDFVQGALRYCRSGEALFPNVVDLCLRIRAVTLPLVIGEAASLAHLALDVDDSNNKICGLVGRLTNLKSLALVFLASKEFKSSEVEALSNLKNLTVLRLQERDSLDECQLSVPWMTDEQFNDWASCFPQLRTLRLDWSGQRLTARATAMLARTCPQISWIGVRWRHGLDTWIAHATIFPVVHTIAVGRLDHVAAYDPR